MKKKNILKFSPITFILPYGLTIAYIFNIIINIIDIFNIQIYLYLFNKLLYIHYIL